MDKEDKEELEKNLIEKFNMLNKEVTPLLCPYCNAEIRKKVILKFRNLGYNKLQSEMGAQKLIGYAFAGKITCESCHKLINSICVGDLSGYSIFIFTKTKDATLCLDKIHRLRKLMIERMGYVDYNLIRVTIHEQAESHLRGQFK